MTESAVSESKHTNIVFSACSVTDFNAVVADAGAALSCFHPGQRLLVGENRLSSVRASMCARITTACSTKQGVVRLMMRAITFVRLSSTCHD